MDKLYTIKQVAKNLQYSKMTIYRYIKSDKLKAIKTGKEYRIKKRDLKSFLKRFEHK